MISFDAPPLPPPGSRYLRRPYGPRKTTLTDLQALILALFIEADGPVAADELYVRFCDLLASLPDDVAGAVSRADAQLPN